MKFISVCNIFGLAAVVALHDQEVTMQLLEFISFLMEPLSHRSQTGLRSTKTFFSSTGLDVGIAPTGVVWKGIPKIRLRFKPPRKCHDYVGIGARAWHVGFVKLDGHDTWLFPIMISCSASSSDEQRTQFSLRRRE